MVSKTYSPDSFLCGNGGIQTICGVIPTEIVRKVLLCTLVEKWWDTTHTLHIAGVKMMITPYDIYRLIGLRVDGITPTFSAFPGRLRPNREYLGMDLGATSTNLPVDTGGKILSIYFFLFYLDFYFS